MNGTSAESMAVAVERDPQFLLPQLPKWVDGLVTVPIDGGLLVEGGPDRQVLRGGASTSLLPRLIAQLNGDRDIAALADELDVSATHIHQAVALLYSCGLLEDGADADPAPPERDPEVRTFLSRQVDSTRVNRSAAGALRRLAAADVCLVGGGRLAALIATDLEATGAGRVQCAALPTAGTTFAIGLSAPGAAPDFAALDDRCAELGIPWLRVVLDGAVVEIGPRFDHAHTACLHCMYAAHGQPDGDHSLAPSSNDDDEDGRLALVAGIAGVQIAHAMARVGATVAPAAVTRIDLLSFVQRVMPVAPRPGCPQCSPQFADDPGRVTLPYAYEHSVAFPPREQLNPKDHQHHYKPGNLRLQRSSKRYPGARRVALEPAEHRPAPMNGSAGQLDRATLAGLLARAFGLRDPGGAPNAGKLDRWAPTGGNLGSPQAYPLVANVASLDPGAYFYLAHAHELAHLPHDGSRAAAIVGAATQEDLGLAATVVVLTGALDRVASKYGTFGYRIVNLDAGCAVAQLALAAAGRGLEVRVASRWDDALIADTLRIDLDSEPLTAVVALGRVGAADA